VPSGQAWQRDGRVRPDRSALLPPDLDYYINLIDLDVDDVAARYRALALETRARGTAMRAQAWCMPPADREDAMPFPSGIRTTTGAPSSIVTTCTNARPRCAEGSGCWRFADPGKTSTGAQVRARLTSRARAASGRSPESGVAMVESSLPTFVIRRAGSNRPKLTRRAGEYRPRRRGTLMSACACARWLARADEVRVASRPRLEGGTTPVQTVFAYRSIAIVVRHWFEIAPQDEEHGCRVELRSVPRLVHRGTESASQMLIIDRALWRADLFDVVGGEPGNFRRAHYHPSFAYTEPTDRVWDQRLTNDPMGWIVDRLQNLAGTVDDQAKAELDLDSDQHAVRRDLEQITRVISLRLGDACPSPQACLSQTSDVRYVVPAMFAQYRRVRHGIDPRDDASSWAGVVSRRDLTLLAEG